MADQEEKVDEITGNIYYTGEDSEAWIKEHFSDYPDARYCIQCGFFLVSPATPRGDISSHAIVYSYEEYLIYLPEVVMARLKGE